MILRPCAWHQLPFGNLLVATTDGKPIVKYTYIDDGFVEVINSVTRALDKLGESESDNLPIASVSRFDTAADDMINVPHRQLVCRPSYSADS